VLGLSSTGLHAVRALARAKFPVLGVTNELAAGSWSRYASRGVVNERDPARLVERLMDFASREPVPPVLIPVTDGYIELLVRYHVELGTRYAFAASYSDGVAADLMDKEQFYETCRRLGVAYPRTVTLKSVAEGRERSGEIRFPAILKPSKAHRARKFLGGRKVIVLRDRRGCDEAIGHLPFADTPWLLQEIVVGPDSNIHVFAAYFDCAGEPVRTFTARKLRQYPPAFGSASLARSEANPRVEALSVEILRAIGFSGLCGAEFKLDARDNRLVAIEINPRPTLWYQLATASGVPLVEAAMRDLAGMPPDPPVAQRDGVVWRYFVRDGYSALAYRIRPDLLSPPPDTSGPVTGRAWPVWDLRDPLPVLGEPIALLARLVRARRRSR
jgi:predicted ATP-grasp superfamily ATP-dependent carboligase